MAQTESLKKRGVRFCADCGYELARDNDGTCPMCRRLEQLGLDFTVPRPSDLATHRAGSRNADVSRIPDARPPTVAEYRAILAERRLRSDSPGQRAATVIRTAAMRQTQVPPPPRGATAPGDGALISPAKTKPPADDQASPSPKKVKARRGQGKSRRAARVRVHSAGTPETTTPPATASTSALVASGDVPATPGSSNPPTAVRAQSVPAAATRSETLTEGKGTSVWEGADEPIARAASAGERLVIAVAIVVASVLIGAAVPILLSLL